MRRLAALALALAASSAFAASPEVKNPEHDCADRPAWCQPGYVCLPTACAAESAAQLDLLTAETEALRARRVRRWACTLGPGAGVYLQVEKGKASFDSAPLVGGIVCGWTF